MSFPFQEAHGWMDQQVFRLKADSTNPNCPPLKGGTHVKVVMVSRFGDCGITTDLKKKTGYSHRVMPWDLEEIPNTKYRYSVDPPESGMMFEVYKSSIVPQLRLHEIEIMIKPLYDKEVADYARDHAKKMPKK